MDSSQNSLPRGLKTPISPSDSVISIGQFRPSLVWLFNHIRQEDRDALTKDDLRELLGASVDSVQLDLAFQHLDTNRSGEISLDEFLGGFAQFLKEAPHTPRPPHYVNFTRPRRRRLETEEFFEAAEEEEGPSEDFKRSLTILSSHNRYAYINMHKEGNTSGVGGALCEDDSAEQ